MSWYGSPRTRRLRQVVNACWEFGVSGAFTGLRFRLLLLMLLLVVPSVGLTLYFGWQQRQRAAAAAKTQALGLTRDASDNCEKLVLSTRQLLATIARLPEVRDGTPSVRSLWLAGMLEQYPQYANLGLADANGDVIASALPRSRPVSVSDIEWFQRALATRRFVVGKYHIGRITGKPTINLAYPILDPPGRVRSVLYAALDLTWLKSIASEAQLPPGSAVTLIDRDGTVLARYPDDGKWAGENLAQAPLLRQMLASSSPATAEGKGPDGVQRLYAFGPLRGLGQSGNLILSIGIPSAVAFAEVDRITVWSLLLQVLVVALALLVARLAVHVFIVRRIEPLVSATRKLAAGDLKVRSGLAEGSDELTELARAFDQLAGALQQRAVEQEQANQSLCESEELFRALSTSSPVGFFMADVHGRRTYANPRYRAILGLTLTQSMTDGWLEAIHPDDRERIGNQWLAFVRGNGAYSPEGRIVAADGRIRWVRAQAAPMHGEDGKLCGFVGTVEDITERKLAEEALRESEHGYRNLVETAQDAIFTLSTDGVLTSLNKAFEEITGWPVAEWMGKPFNLIIHPDDLPVAVPVLKRVLETAKPSLFELRILSKRGGYVAVELTVTPQLREGKVAGLLGIARNITERRRLEDELRQAQKMEAIGRLAGGVAHDFNNILTAINGYSELLSRRLGERDPLRSYVEEINKAGTGRHRSPASCWRSAANRCCSRWCWI